MKLLLLVIITTFYLAFPPPAQCALAQRYESAPLKPYLQNLCDCDDVDDDGDRNGDSSKFPLSCKGKTGDDDDDDGHHHKFPWSYKGKTGPRYWAEHYPHCRGKRQSPIDLYNGDRVTTWSPFRFYNYNVTPTSVHVTNNGVTAEFTMDMSNRPYVRGGNLNGEYVFDQLHFHWGSNNSVGSEHLIKHRRYPCEAHLVHYRSIYKNTCKAMKYKGGLAVLSVLFTITEDNNTALTNLIEGLAKVASAKLGHEVKTEPFPLSAILPSNRDKFYRYHGSLTTPTCCEVVVWTIFDEKLSISATQMAQFRTLKDAYGHALVDNYRPVQPLGRRKLYFADLD